MHALIILSNKAHAYTDSNKYIKGTRIVGYRKEKEEKEVERGRGGGGGGGSQGWGKR